MQRSTVFLFYPSSPCGGAGISGHSKIVEDEACIQDEFAHLLSDATNLFGFDDADSEAPESCDVFRSMALADAAFVFAS